MGKQKINIVTIFVILIRNSSSINNTNRDSNNSGNLIIFVGILSNRIWKNKKKIVSFTNYSSMEQKSILSVVLWYLICYCLCYTAFQGYFSFLQKLMICINKLLSNLKSGMKYIFAYTIAHRQFSKRDTNDIFCFKLKN